MSRPRALAAVLFALVTSVACAGCGFGLGLKQGAVRLRVTQDFGTRQMGAISTLQARRG